MWLLQTGLTLAVLYAAVVAGMYLAQTWQLFPATLAGLARVHRPASAERREVGTPEGEVLVTRAAGNAVLARAERRNAKISRDRLLVRRSRRCSRVRPGTG
jgi:hypothetical protein